MVNKQSPENHLASNDRLSPESEHLIDSSTRFFLQETCVAFFSGMALTHMFTFCFVVVACDRMALSPCKAERPQHRISPGADGKYGRGIPRQFNCIQVEQICFTSFLLILQSLAPFPRKVNPPNQKWHLSFTKP